VVIPLFIEKLLPGFEEGAKTKVIPEKSKGRTAKRGFMTGIMGTHKG
jgi:hypothetical protein